jgi:hypothetical protein
MTMNDVTPNTIISWFANTVAASLDLDISAVLISTTDNAPDTIPPASVFCLISPRDMRFIIEEQSPEQITCEFRVRVRLYLRYSVDQPGSIARALLDSEIGLYRLCQKVISGVLKTALPSGNLRGCFAAEVSSPMEWVAPPDGQLSFLTTAIDFRADFDWAVRDDA